MGDHDGRVALVTGGSQGIGLGAATALVRQGSAVVLHGLDLAGAEAAAAGLRRAGGTVVATAGPIDDPATTQAAVQLAHDRFGRLDSLVTAAGIQRYGDVMATTPGLWHEVLAVNLTGVFLATRAAMPLLRTSGAGSVTIVASVQGSATQRGVVAYTTSKGALLALARALAVDEAPYSVRVNSVSPGSIDTPMLRASARRFGDPIGLSDDEVLADWGTAHALGRVGRPDEVGEVIAFVAGRRASFVTGADLRVDGGLLARLAASIPNATSAGPSPDAGPRPTDHRQES